MFPKVVCRIGFASDPSTPIAQTNWTDVTAYLLEAGGAGGGRAYELDDTQAGRMTVRLDNRDRRFEPEYAAGAYYPNVVPMRRIQLLIGENAVPNPSFETDLSDWSVVSQFTIARSTVQALIGRASLKATYTAGTADPTLAYCNATAPAAGRYAFATYVYVPAAWNGGTIQMTAANYVGATEVTALRRDADLTKRDQWQRIWRVYDLVGGDLAGNPAVLCSAFPSSGTPFVYLDGVQVATLDADGEPQPHTDRQYEKFSGYVESWPPAYESAGLVSTVDVKCVDGIEPLAQASILGGPNLVTNPSFEADTSGWTPTNGTITRDTTRAVAGAASGKLTAHATLTPSEVRPAGLGLEAGRSYALSARVWIPSGVGITPANVTVGLGAAGASEVAGAAAALFDQWQRIVLPTLFTGQSQVRTFGRTTPGTGLTLMQGDTAANGDPVGSNKQVTKFTLADPALITSLHIDITGHGGAGPQQLVRGVLYADSAGTPGLLLGQTAERVIPRNTALRQFEKFDFDAPIVVPAGTYWLGYLGGETSQALYVGSVAAGGDRAYNTDSYADGPAGSFGPATLDTLQLAIYATYTVSLAATSYGFVRINEAGASKFVNIDEIVIREVDPADASLADPAGADLSAAVAGFRIHRLLNAAGWPVADRAIDTGTAVVAATSVDSDSDVKARGMILDTAKADVGLFFMSAAGRAVFHGRERRFNPSSLFTLTDAGTFGPDLFPYSDLAPSYDKDKIRNDVRITPANGAAQLVADATSVSKYLQRTLADSLAVNDEAQALYTAQAILQRQKDPHLRFDSVQLEPVAHESTAPGLLNRVLAGENSDAITVIAHPPGGGSPLTKVVHREQASFKLDKPGFLTETWQLTPVDTNAYLKLDDATLGLLDSGNVAAF